MRRPSAPLAAVLSLALLLGVATLTRPVPVAAQAAVPPGTALPVVDADGGTHGTIAVSNVADPFTGFDPNQPPEQGKHFVALTVVFDANAGKKLDIDPSVVVLQDAGGNLWRPTYLPLPNDATVPQLTGQSLGPGSRISGLLGFAVPDGATLSRVWYKPNSDHLFPLADLAIQAPPAVGKPTTIVDSNGNAGAVTVTGIDDLFIGFDPSNPPTAGSRFVVLTLVYENAGKSRFDVEPYGLMLRDAQGRLWNPTSVSRPSDQVVVPDLTGRQLAPGDRISGVIAFDLPDGVGVGQLYWQPNGNQLIELADFATGEATPAPSSPATPVASPAAAAPSASADPCHDIAVWLAATRGRIQQASAMSIDDATLSDSAALRTHQQAYADLADAQAKESAPTAAQAVNHALIATLQAYSQAVQGLAAATAPGADPNADMTDPINTFNAAGDRLSAIERQLSTVAGGCGLS